MSHDELIIMGRVSGLFGIRGWLKIYSHTSPRDGIVDYKTWYLKQGGNWKQYKLTAGHSQGKGVVAQLDGISDRDQAAELVDCEIAIQRTQLPELEPDEYYWTDLQGLRVVNIEGVELGVVSHLFETGANDVMVVKGERERLIPYTTGEAVQSVDLDAGILLVDWDPEF
ncbi:MAG: ribosome maturation factor RimM [Candidatus Thiodiazotropha sp.]|nr:ribosome maturation factor RimM [Candidatus Thiodiazotropha sp.]MCU7839473.1 ribosome maturation factor RimM [Candidatus Thiodiazotropha sp. (ex Troendleina suluensis)]MCU7882722.1 ribosome maturation factor RimM [Candidatus Thiodiazotropha sp. (ex Lucinoma annulata)]MCU7945844.1 ribosome maturation factor RimM [Candidatus Thiodiazotropha sp. (ex Cardiolucina cf. quadrata)]MCM8884218.1 ribosome maturation factor RimM [Candidatus Thiodiazotropha sp.]